MQPKDIVPVPQWCIDNAFKGIYANRVEACEIFGITLTTTRTTDGVTTTTGVADIDAYSYAYTSTTLSTWGHQMQVGAWGGWGDALGASVEGTASASGACTVRSSNFPPQPLEPLNSVRNGEAYFDTTATAAGAIGHCTTTWNLVFKVPSYTDTGLSQSTTDIRCDNATGGNPNVGCVVPWYPSALVYSQSAYPSLASHVARAQASGLPGATFAATLTRTTNDTIANRNRALACGDAPSLPNLSCDEYPIARSYQGLTAGGTRRSFDGCNFDQLPRQTGPTGASVCMITATENNAQGGLNTQFFRGDRVLDGDPFRIVIGA